MKTLMMVVVLVLSASVSFAQTGIALDTRFAVRSDGQQTYRLVEVYQTSGRVIPWDVGVIDFGADAYHEIYAGAGGIPIATKKVTFITEGYFVQSVGADADSARYLQPFLLLIMDFGRGWSATVNHLIYLPLNKPATFQHVLDKAKLEYDFGSFKAGAGFGGYKFGRNEWQNYPFVTGTLKLGRAGSLEVWLQNTPDGNQVRFNYLVSRKK